MDRSEFSAGLAAKFVGGWAEAGGTTAELNALAEDGDQLHRLIAVRRGYAEIKPLDPIIRVDRTISPTYPNWMEEVIHPELEATGPDNFDVGALDQWLHPKQEKGMVTGEVIHKYLKQNKMLTSYLGLRDLEEIQKKGIAFFRKFFSSKAVFGWKSVVRRRFGCLCVPYLFEHGGVVVLDWRWLGNGWGDGDPALRLASPANGGTS